MIRSEEREGGDVTYTRSWSRGMNRSMSSICTSVTMSLIKRSNRFAPFFTFGSGSAESCRYM